jgi:EAL and modified HD-GYP domain-containing signal transduction protein
MFDRRMRVAGYELLFRQGYVHEASVIDDVAATANVMLNVFTEIGPERIVGPHPGWINVSRDFVLRGLAEVAPPGLVGLEILEGQVIDDEFVAAVAGLKEQGYRLSLDDFEYTPDADRLLDIVDMVKLDIMALGPARFTAHVAQARQRGLSVLAEKVETHEDHAFCMAAGCDLFQGYFYRRPKLFAPARVEANRAGLMELIAALHDPQAELQELERLIVRDVALSVRLLRYINSAFFGLAMEVTSIGQALALLGIENLKRWATLTVFASIEGKPAELTITALTRGRFCELAGARPTFVEPSQLFTLGLFSVIEALLDTPIQEVLESIPFPQQMRDALIVHNGDMGRLLDCVTALELGEFERAEKLVPGCAQAHTDAIVWANDAADPLFGGM